MTPASNRPPAPRIDVASAIIPGRRRSDVVEIVTHRDGVVDVALLDVRAARGQDEFRDRLQTAVHAALELRLPLHEVARYIRNVISLAVAGSVGVTLLRVCDAEDRIELLNAGMPPVACIFPDGRLLALPALSVDVGPRSPNAHPYEMMPLTRGSLWVLASDGATGGMLDDAGTLWSALGLPGRADELGMLSSEELTGRLDVELRTDSPPEDASLVVVRTTVRPLASGMAIKQS